MTPEQKEKARWSRIFRVYGITKEQFEELDLGYCPICLRPWSETVRPCIDHNHVDSTIRGVLCLYCNHRVVGRHRDHLLIQRVADYLRGPHTDWIVPKKKPKRRKKKK